MQTTWPIVENNLSIAKSIIKLQQIYHMILHVSKYYVYYKTLTFVQSYLVANFETINNSNLEIYVYLHQLTGRIE